jgi:hypothetical protein
MNHTLSEGNQCKNFLVKLGASSNFEFLCHEPPPMDLLNFLRGDAAGLFYLKVLLFFFFSISFVFLFLFCFSFVHKKRHII